MGVVLLALTLSAGEDVDLPVRLSEPIRLDREEIFGVEVFALRTAFDSGLRVDDGYGVGGDLNFRWQWDEKVRFGFSAGYAVWDIDTDFDGLPARDVDVAQYRAGVGAEFPFGKVVDLGLAITGGVYRFSRDGDNDTSPYLEFEGSLGVRPIPQIRFGGLVMATHTQSGFNRSHTHLFHNYSAGLMLELSY